MTTGFKFPILNSDGSITFYENFGFTANAAAPNTSGVIIGTGASTSVYPVLGVPNPNMPVPDGASYTTLTGVNDASFKNIAVGLGVLAIKVDGSLWSWANNIYGQLGLNDVTPRSSPTQIGTATDWQTLPEYDTYSSCSFAIKTNGTLWAWGNNQNGALGLQDLVHRSSPTQVGSLTNWKTIGQGNTFALAIKNDGTLWGWGFNAYGQLGLNDIVARSSPVQVGTLTNWKQVAMSANHTAAAVKTDGTLWTWGLNNTGQLGLNDIVHRSSPVQVGSLTNWSQVTTTSGGMAAIKTDGTLWTWGWNFNGALGQNTADGTYASSPVQVGSLTNWAKVISNGSYFYAAQKTDGTLWAWGSNSSGQLGQGDRVNRSSPVQVGSISNWTKVICGNPQNIVGIAPGIAPRSLYSLTTDFEDVLVSKDSFTNTGLYGFGYNISGQLGVGDALDKTSPVQVGTLTNWKMIRAGLGFSVGLKTDGTLWTWGQNNNGQLGLIDVTNRSSPVQVGVQTDWGFVTAGDAAVFAIKYDGSLWVWGNNAIGDLGIGDIVHRSSPVQVGSLTNWKQVSIGLRSALALKTDGSLWSWGAADQGVLGQNNVNNLSSPVQIGSLTDWKFIAACRYYSFAIKTNGTLWSWGSNANGQLGHNDITHRSSPVQVGSLTNWKQVADGARRHTLAVKTDGTLWTWGQNAGDGQLGLNDTSSRSSPVQVGLLTDWKFVSGGYYHSTALKTDGTLWTWGRSTNGQTGTGATRSSPTQVGTITSWNLLNAGSYHTMAAITTDY